MELSFISGERAGIYTAIGELASYRISRCPIVKEYIVEVTPIDVKEVNGSKASYFVTKANGERQSFFALLGAKNKANSLDNPNKPRATKASSPKTKEVVKASSLDFLDDVTLGTVVGAINSLERLLELTKKSKNPEILGIAFSLGLNSRVRASVLEELTKEIEIRDNDRKALEAPLPTAEYFAPSTPTIEREGKLLEAIEGAIEDIKLEEEIASNGSLGEINSTPCERCSLPNAEVYTTRDIELGIEKVEVFCPECIAFYKANPRAGIEEGLEVK